MENLSTLLNGIKLFDPIEKKQILLNSLWEGNKVPLVLIHWVRRFGCPLCMLGAKNISSYIKNINQKLPDSLDCAAIGMSELDYQDFVDKGYFSGGKIYLDEEKTSYKALSFQRKGWFSLLNPWLYISSIKTMYQGIYGNLKGDGFQLGGTIICDYKGDVIYRHIQKSYDDFPTEKDINDVVIKYYLDNEDK